jgi:hypothetical protein
MYSLFYLCVVLLVVVGSNASPYCSSIQSDWLTRLGDNNDTTCGERWQKLMPLEASRLIVQENRLWIVGFHKYATGILNRRSLMGVGTSLDVFNTSGVNEALLLLGDSLEATCANFSQWKLSPVIMDAMLLVDNFNHGIVVGIPPLPLCSPPPATFPDTFYYYESADTLTIKDPQTNLTYTQSLVRGLYNTNYFQYAMIVLEAFVILLLAIKLLMVQNQNREYYAKSRRKNGADYIEMQQVRERGSGEDEVISEIVLSQDDEDGSNNGMINVVI